MRQLCTTRLQSQLKSPQLIVSSSTPPKAAGLLVPLFFENDECHVLLTKRAAHMRSHAGEVAFPGGKVDPTDRNEVDAALREAWEEVGIEPTSVQVIGTLPNSMPSKHGIPCWAVIGLIPKPRWPSVISYQSDESFDLKLSIDEVDVAFSVPLSTFLGEANHRFSDIEWQGRNIRLHFWDLEVAEFQRASNPIGTLEGAKESICVWGLTARVCSDVISIFRFYLIHDSTRAQFLIEVAKMVYDRQPDYPQLATQVVPLSDSPASVTSSATKL